MRKENKEKAKRAEKILKEYQKQTGSEEETALYDLLSDLMHFADLKNMDFDEQLIWANYHYAAEVRGDE